MASTIIHMCVAKEISKKVKINDLKLFYLGSIAPDLSKQIGLSKDKSHFLDEVGDDIPNTERFLDKYKNSLDDEFILGYFVHLFTDKIWYQEFLKNKRFENSVKLLNGSVVSLGEDGVINLIYNDYTSLNVDLIDRYELDLSIFFEPLDKIETTLDEIPVDEMQILVDKMGIIIANSKKSTSLMFDIRAVSDFIEICIKNIVYILDNMEKNA